MWMFSDVSTTNSVPIFRVCWWFGRTKAVVLPIHRHILNIRRGIVTETSEILRILSRLSVWENFIEFCRCESIKTCTNTRYWTGNSSVRFLQTVQHIKTFFISRKRSLFEILFFGNLWTSTRGHLRQASVIFAPYQEKTAICPQILQQ
jgi:hypothetical protein